MGRNAIRESRLGDESTAQRAAVGRRETGQRGNQSRDEESMLGKADNRAREAGTAV